MTACYFTLQDVIGHEWLWENKEEIRIGGDPEDLDEDVIGAVTFHQCSSVVCFTHRSEWGCIHNISFQHLFQLVRI